MSQFNPTTKTQAALSAAVQAASAAGNPDVRPGHLLVALLEQQDGIAGPLLQACGVDPQLALTQAKGLVGGYPCLLYTSPSPRDRTRSRMPSSA